MQDPELELELEQVTKATNGMEANIRIPKIIPGIRVIKIKGNVEDVLLDQI